MPGLGTGLVQQGGDAAGGRDGTILYIDPNDPQAAEILQQAGLRLTDDGTVTSLAQDAASAPTSAAVTTTTSAPSMEPLDVAPPPAAPAASASPAAAALPNLGAAEGDLSMPLIEESKVATPPVRWNL